MKRTAAVIQFHVSAEDHSYNLRRAEELLRAAAADGAEIMVLPELWNSGYALDQLPELAALREPSMAMLCRVAKETGTCICGGTMVEEKQGHYYNTLTLIDENGMPVAKYRKTHLFSSYLHEDEYFTPGDSFSNWDWTREGETVRLGLSVCYDLRFPELYRNLALRGAKVFLAPTCWAKRRYSEYELFCRARAAENRAFLLSCNYTDPECRIYQGGSLIVNPCGEVIARAGTEEGYAIAELDFDILSKPWAFNSVADRRPFIDEIDNNLL